MAYTAWYVHCRTLMDFFESKPTDKDDVLATHYLDQPDEWRELVKKAKSPKYDDMAEAANKLMAHLTYARCSYQGAADPDEYRPSQEVTDCLLALSQAFYERLASERKVWFGGLFR